MPDYCHHPTRDVVYHMDFDEGGREVESYWCRVCNRWIPNGFIQEIRERPEWTGWLSEDEVYRHL